MGLSRRQRGEGQLGCVVGLIILLAAGFIAYKMVPVKVKSAELRGTIVDSARSAGMLNDIRIRKQIMARAKDLELPLEERNLSVRRSAGQIRIEADYTVPVDFPGFTYQWKFRHVAQNPIF
ncbi:MAG TPA: hypothetical protein VMS56_10010 [Thermoanaerobaculia bacterium]|nr:hypothetical protein [Thermoanaerobaculia bacterium]